MQVFGDFFRQITTHNEPRPWQEQLASESTCKSKVIRIPTGLGKTEGVLAAWAYNLLIKESKDWPIRLVWCLPMRVLVEQTREIALQLADRIPEPYRPTIHVAMGGEDIGEWFLYPERPAVIIGTQDMLLSRALNRGYACARARWPMEFGLLNHDALWIMDEVQLMDVGLATSAQLQAFRDCDRSKRLRPCHTWWMSATLQPSWLRSVDTAQHHDSWVASPCEVPSEQRTGGLWAIPKSASTTTIAPDGHTAFATRILEEHAKLTDGAFGKITLVVCNTVERASLTFDALRKDRRTEGLELLHSRFRPAEREVWRDRFLSRTTCRPGVDRIIVATQVVEAGVDISAGCVITELAPWPSLVQRFGRCARYGGTGSVLVVNRGLDDKQTAPYMPKELESAWETIQNLRDVGIQGLELHESSLNEEAKHRLYPYDPAHLLLRKEFDELFDTTPDLTGADIDISRFIRTGDERDLQVFWLNIPKAKKGEKAQLPPEDYKPNRRELCSIPFLKAREWLCEKGKSKLKANRRAWVWDWLDGEWKTATGEALLPGRIVCVASDNGGYSTDRGFDAEANTLVAPIAEPKMPPEKQAVEEADNQQNSEQLSLNSWKTIACHSREVANHAREIAQQLSLSNELKSLLELAAIWHDWGKAHPAFQGSIRNNENIARLARMDLAKAPDGCWPKKCLYQYLDNSENRPAFRHELASALGLFSLLETYAPRHNALLGPWVAVLELMNHSLSDKEPPLPPTPLIKRLLDCNADQFDLIAYLVASHHGKVRAGIHAAPKDQDYRDRDGRGLPIRGIREGDRLPSVELVSGEPPIPEMALTLSPASLGLSSRTGVSWRERCIRLMDRYGPAALAFLEAILRAADVRASRLKTNDPSLSGEAGT